MSATAVAALLAHDRAIPPLGGYRPGGLAPTQEIVFHRPAVGIAKDHPDAGLLALCGHLRALQARWQSLWEATSDDGNQGTPADRLFDDFAERVWPGYRADPLIDPVAGLMFLRFRATTPEGLRAKAAAVLAISEAGGYSGCCRDDECELQLAVLGELAGGMAVPLGIDADADA